MKSSGISKVSLMLLSLVAVVIAAATFVEDVHDTTFVMQCVYGSWWMRLLWMAVAVTGMVAMWRRRLWRRFSVCLLHVSFLVILAGGLMTALTSRGGMIHLRGHEPVGVYMSKERTVEPLPFTLELDTFYIDYYPGTEAHRGYTSRVRVDGGEIVSIGMNRILQQRGWRLYQTSFDADRQGSWLTATFDPYGTAVTYVGYLLLALAAVLLLIDRRESFCSLLHHPALKRGLACVGAVLCFHLAAHGHLPVVPVQQADAMKSMQVVYGDRVVPLNTVAIDFVQKLYGGRSFGGFTPEQVLVSWQRHPQQWRDVRMLQVNQKQRVLLERLGLEGPYLCVNDLFDSEGRYRLQDLLMEELGTHSPLEKAIQAVDEKVGVVLMLEQGTLFRPLPQDGSVSPLSEAKVKAELLYNAVPFSKILFMMNLTLGFLLFVVMLWSMLSGRPVRPALVRGWGMGLLLLAFVFQLMGYVLRWYISGTVPLTNGYETMQFVALVTMLIALLLSLFTAHLSMLTLSGGFLISGFTLLVSYLGQMNPRITSLMPVLQSPWLSSHVSLIMISYSLFAFIALNAIVALILLALKKSEAHRTSLEVLTVLSRLLLYPAVLLLAIGIFLGAIWANVSWGSYWSWDPKEVWALVTMIVYGIAFHRQSLSFLRRPLFFHLYMLFAFLTVLMTYFGVNYLLGGMHSYAG
ncbi:MAG: cytochrome c biogenesis protein CcsA [Bacteroidaceae bacterium]|nr:cytochrome c biogenesis protein CcsA [Bacteroidaceae bacterium]